MNLLKVKAALQDLIIRLQDAEKGYLEISNGTSNPILKRWMEKYSTERHEFHKQLEYEVNKMGKSAEVRTSFLGDLHRVFIDMKMSLTDDSFTAIVDEIERGSSFLINDYDKTLELDLSPDLRILLQAQKQKITEEIESLSLLKEELLTPA